MPPPRPRPPIRVPKRKSDAEDDGSKAPRTDDATIRAPKRKLDKKQLPKKKPRTEDAPNNASDESEYTRAKENAEKWKQAKKMEEYKAKLDEMASAKYPNASDESEFTKAKEKAKKRIVYKPPQEEANNQNPNDLNDFNYREEADSSLAEQQMRIRSRVDNYQKAELNAYLKDKYGKTPSNYTHSKVGIAQLNAILDKYTGPVIPQGEKADGNGLPPPPPSKKTFYGRGFSQTNMSPKLFVDLEHLKRDKLTIKYKSTGKIQSSVAIPSPECKQAITDLIIGRYDEKQYKKLSKENKAFIDSFIANSKLRFEPIDNEEQQLKAKWDVLCGEVRAGNDSSEIPKMLMNVAERLFALRRITKNKYLQIKNELIQTTTNPTAIPIS